MSIGFVYCITNAVNGKIYIGKTIKPIEHRLAQHLSYSEKPNKKRLSQAIRKYGAENFSISLVEEVSITELRNAEKHYIRTLQPEYNMTDGGEGQDGLVWITDGVCTRRIDVLLPIPEGFSLGQSPAMIAARAKGQTGKKNSPQALANKKAAALKRWQTCEKQYFSPEARAAMAVASRRSKSPETILRMKEAAKLRWAKARGEIS